MIGFARIAERRRRPGVPNHAVLLGRSRRVARDGDDAGDGAERQGPQRELRVL